MSTFLVHLLKKDNKKTTVHHMVNGHIYIHIYAYICTYLHVYSRSRQVQQRDSQSKGAHNMCLDVGKSQHTGSSTKKPRCGVRRRMTAKAEWCPVAPNLPYRLACCCSAHIRRSVRNSFKSLRRRRNERTGTCNVSFRLIE